MKRADVSLQGRDWDEVKTAVKCCVRQIPIRITGSTSSEIDLVDGRWQPGNRVDEGERCPTLFETGDDAENTDLAHVQDAVCDRTKIGFERSRVCLGARTSRR